MTVTNMGGIPMHTSTDAFFSRVCLRATYRTRHTFVTQIPLWPMHGAGARRMCCQPRASAAGKTTVVLTREAGKNGKMQKALGKLGFECIELPLIEHTSGADR